MISVKTYAPQDNPFYSLHAEVTHRCNMNCFNCYLPNRTEPDLDESEFKSFLSLLPKRTDIRLIGAEPTLHPKINELISIVRNEGHRPILITNGLKLADPGYLNLLKNSGLRRVGISLNGADDYELYKLLDNAPKDFVDKKVKALNNLLSSGMIVSTQSIISRGKNENVISSMMSLLEEVFKNNNLLTSKLRMPLICRFKSIGEIGRYQENSSMSLDELVSLTSNQLGVREDFIKSHNKIDSFNECNSYLFPYELSVGTVYIKLTDWSTDSRGVPDPNNFRRGRITKDWKVASCFEHIKQNEFGF